VADMKISKAGKNEAKLRECGGLFHASGVGRVTRDGQPDQRQAHLGGRDPVRAAGAGWGISAPVPNLRWHDAAEHTFTPGASWLHINRAHNTKFGNLPATRRNDGHGKPPRGTLAG